MTSPETLVRNFIEDYFHWNERAGYLEQQVRLTRDAALSALGIEEPPPGRARNFEQLVDQPEIFEQFLKIQHRQAEDNAKMIARVESDWQKLLEKYCLPNCRAGWSFGTPSDHDPNRENIVSVETVDKKSVVKTHRDDDFSPDYYEFHLIYRHERWYLEKIYSDWGEEKIKVL